MSKSVRWLIFCMFVRGAVILRRHDYLPNLTQCCGTATRQTIAQAAEQRKAQRLQEKDSVRLLVAV